MTLAAYADLGGLAGAVAGRAEELCASVDRCRGRAAAVHAVWSTPGEGTEDTRRRARRSELSGVPEEVVDAFGAARLLAFDHDPATREPTVEVAHEALIRNWPRLRAWLAEDRDALRVLRHLSDSAGAWDAAWPRRQRALPRRPTRRRDRPRRDESRPPHRSRVRVREREPRRSRCRRAPPSPQHTTLTPFRGGARRCARCARCSPVPSPSTSSETRRMPRPRRASRPRSPKSRRRSLALAACSRTHKSSHPRTFKSPCSWRARRSISTPPSTPRVSSVSSHPGSSASKRLAASRDSRIGSGPMVERFPCRRRTERSTCGTPRRGRSPKLCEQATLLSTQSSPPTGAIW